MATDLNATIEALRQEVRRGFKTEARLYAVQERLDDQLQMMSRLYQVGRDLHSTFDLTRISEVATAFALYDLGFDRCVVVLLDASGAPRVAAQDGFYEEGDEERLASVPLGPLLGIAGDAADGEVLREHGDLVELLGVDHCFACPLGGNEQRLGLLVVGASRNPSTDARRGLDQTVAALASLADRVGGAIAQAMLYQELAHERARLEQKVRERTFELSQAYDEVTLAFDRLADRDARITADLMQARDFQRTILPRIDDLPAFADIEVEYLPAELVGGDFYDVAMLRLGGRWRLRVLVVDTTGHGVQASLATMMLMAEWDRVKETEDRPGAALRALNDVLAGTYAHLDLRCSAFCADLDPATRRVDYSTAAHPPGLLVSQNGLVELPTGGPFVGLLPGVEFPEGHALLRPGQRLFVHTDGAEVSESGVAGLRAAIRAGLEAGRSPVSAALAFVRATPPRSADEADDVTLLSLGLR